jgi:hypothetical protein
LQKQKKVLCRIFAAQPMLQCSSCIGVVIRYSIRLSGAAHPTSV